LLKGEIASFVHAEWQHWTGGLATISPNLVFPRRVKAPYLSQCVTTVFFNFFAAAEPYISVKVTHGTPWHAVIRESNGVGKVEFSGCLGTDVPSGVERQKTCASLGQNPAGEATGKRLV